MIVVSDVSPLIGLAAVGELRVLRELYREVLIPEQVFSEACTPGRPGSSEIAEAGWIRRRSVEDVGLVERLIVDLDRGEAEAIALAVGPIIDRMAAAVAFRISPSLYDATLRAAGE